MQAVQQRFHGIDADGNARKGAGFSAGGRHKARLFPTLPLLLVGPVASFLALPTTGALWRGTYPNRETIEL
jgi:hypothetical protein